MATNFHHQGIIQLLGRQGIALDTRLNQSLVQQVLTTVRIPRKIDSTVRSVVLTSRPISEPVAAVAHGMFSARLGPEAAAG